MRCRSCRQEALPGTTRCEKHRDKHRESESRRKNKRRADGVCPHCSSPPAPGKVLCESHAAMFRDGARKRRDDGVCLRCPAPASAAAMCLRCWFKDKARYCLGLRGEEAHEGGKMIREIWEGQGGLCALTGRVLIPGGNASLDHVVPSAKGGSDERSNLRWLDLDVNRAKNIMSDEEFVSMCLEVAALRPR